VRSEGRQDFLLFPLRDLEEIEGPSQFRRDLIEFCGGDPKLPMGFFKTERRRAGLGRCVLEWTARNLTDL